MLKTKNIKAVSARLGHADIKITLDTYAHVLPEMEEEIITAMDQIFAPVAGNGDLPHFMPHQTKEGPNQKSQHKLDKGLTVNKQKRNTRRPSPGVLYGEELVPNSNFPWAWVEVSRLVFTSLTTVERTRRLNLREKEKFVASPQERSKIAVF